MGRFHRHDGEAGPTGPLPDHSAYETGRERIDVLERILGENERTAQRNRADLDRAGVCGVNLMSAPGAGKTALLERTLRSLRELRVGVVEGDIETGLDAERLRGLAAHVELVNTARGFGGECHLDAVMVRSALQRMALANLDLVLIENVGNLVCPAEFDTGAHVRAMIVSVAEGEDKPLKYPVMFRACDLVVVNKVDLLPHLDFDLGLLLDNIRAVNPAARALQISARTGAGVAEWCDWLRQQAWGVRSLR